MKCAGLCLCNFCSRGVLPNSCSSQLFSTLHEQSYFVWYLALGMASMQKCFAYSPASHEYCIWNQAGYMLTNSEVISSVQNIVPVTSGQRSQCSMLVWHVACMLIVEIIACHGTKCRCCAPDAICMQLFTSIGSRCSCCLCNTLCCNCCCSGLHNSTAIIFRDLTWLNVSYTSNLVPTTPIPSAASQSTVGRLPLQQKFALFQQFLRVCTNGRVVQFGELTILVTCRYAPGLLHLWKLTVSVVGYTRRFVLHSLMQAQCVMSFACLLPQ